MIRLIPYLLLLVLMPQLLQAQQDIISFNRIKINDGLPNPEIRSIIQDSKGFMWFATDRGLLKYDGYKFRIFKFNLDDNSSLSNDNVHDVMEDNFRNLWISTYSGLNKFNRKNLSFTPFYVDNNIKTSTSTNFFLRSEIDPKGQIWTIIADKGLHFFNPESEKFKEFKFPTGTPGNPKNQDISAFHISKTGSIWFASTDEENIVRLFEYNTLTSKLRLFLPTLDALEGLANVGISKVYEDRKGNIWLGLHNGISKLDIKTDKFTHYLPNEKLPNSIPSGIVAAFEEDDEGMLWIGFTDNGLARLNLHSKEFHHFKNNSKDKKSLNSNNVMCLYNDHQGMLWIGTDKGLNTISLKKKIFKNYLYTLEEDSISHENQITDLYTDKNNIIWFCNKFGLNKFDGISPPELVLPVSCKELVQDSSGKFWLIANGLKSFDPQNEELISYPASANHPDSINNDNIWSLYIDTEDHLWMGTGGGGLNGFDLKSGKVVHYLHNPFDENTISTNEVGPILRDNDELWIGPYYGGLNCINLKSGKITRFLPNPNDPESLSHEVVSAIHKDKKERIWVGTYSGVNVLDKEQKKFFRINEKTNLASEHISVNGITEDKKGNIWVATSAGISKINPETFVVRNYNSKDGLQENPRATLYKNSEGIIYLFGSNGITAFQPEELEDNLLPPQVSITDFLLFNRSIVPGTHPSLKEDISETKEIFISYKEAFLTFEYAAHNYYLTEKNQYAYKMEGFDDEWIQAGTQRFATYTNLPSGKTYTFRVKASNNDGIWNETGTSVNIYIIPPFWQTWWFHLLLACLTVAFLYSLYRWRTHQHYLQRKMLEKMVIERTEEVEAQKEKLAAHAEHLKMANREIKIKNKKIIRQANKLKYIDKLKSKFLANISHEFRTPLTLILAPLEEMISKASHNGATRSQLSMMSRNARRLLQLINQLLDLSKIENGTLTMEHSRGDLVHHIKIIASSFILIAKKHSITFDVFSHQNEIVTCYDADTIEKIINNLLSNAFKFTSDGGRISLEISLNPVHADKEQKQEKQLIITIKDSGVGISPRHLPFIFNRFYQGENNSIRKSDGTGIGLALTKELVELQGGKIQVESQTGIGTCFEVILPLQDDLQEILPSTEIIQISKSIHELPEEEVEESINTEELAEDSSLILIVEDNDDLRQLIRSIFCAEYKIEEAVNGLQGWEFTRKLLPDLVISDVMMPGQDGLSLVNQLKNDPETSHIPTILLTARVDAEEEGLKLGADDYITKPFNTKILALKVKNLLETRNKFKEIIRRDLGLQPAPPSTEPDFLNPHNKVFLEKASEIVLQHLPDVNFEIEILYRELAMSRSLVYKKLKSLTGLGPNEFIRHIRINKAANLLKEGNISVTDVMYQVGFSHRSYFIKCFRKQFNCLPSEFASSFQFTNSVPLGFTSDAT